MNIKISLRPISKTSETRFWEYYCECFTAGNGRPFKEMLPGDLADVTEICITDESEGNITEKAYEHMSDILKCASLDYGCPTITICAGDTQLFRIKTETC